MTIIFDGVRIETPGLETVNWLDNPKVPRVRDGRVRTLSPLSIVLHTVHGRSGALLPDGQPSTRAEGYAVYQANTSREVSWHATVDLDGTVVQSADFKSWTCWHAGHVNPWTVGIEMVQLANGDQYQATIDATVKLVTLLCERLNIPKRVPVDAHGAPLRGVVPTWQSITKGGKAERWHGVLAHHHVTTERGPGDPGPHIFRALLAAGFTGETL